MIFVRRRGDFATAACRFVALLTGLSIACGTIPTALAEPDTSKLATADRGPNVVVIFIDDMGYADINPFGASDYKTPHLNRMAAEGRRFTDFVVSSAVCSASRAALLTGCYHRRVGISGALGPSSTRGLSPRETTLAEICHSAGYATACFGKWHLGHHPKFLPTRHGFDVFYGIPYSNDMWPLHPDTIRRQKRNPAAKGNWPPLPMLSGAAGSSVEVVNPDVQPADQEQMTTEFTRRAVDFIREHRDEPFFVYLPHPMVHVPLYVSGKFRGKSGAGLFGDVVMEVDWSVGQVLDAVESIGQEENTLVIFTSDNGPWLAYGNHAGKSGELREGKGTMWEGGYREPTIMWWPGKIPAGTTCDELSSSIDLLPTITRLIGGELPDLPIDGRDITPLMFDAPETKSPHAAFACYYGGGQLQAVRNERFKLVFPHKYRTLGGQPGGINGIPSAYRMETAAPALYDLDADVGETTDVRDQHPAVVRELNRHAELFRQDLGDRLSDVEGTGTRPAGELKADEPRLLW